MENECAKIPTDIEHKPIKPLLSLKEVASKLRVHRTTVSRYVHSGELRCVPIGRRLMFDGDDVTDFINSRKQLFENWVGQGCVMGKE
jgi:excisionase family DNA binding protein